MRESTNAAVASATLARPAKTSVPGRPKAGMRRKTDASTPKTAPRLFRK
jgi:hypothetical protein